jgi:hypothetical protein
MLFSKKIVKVKKEDNGEIVYVFEGQKYKNKEDLQSYIARFHQCENIRCSIVNTGQYILEYGFLINLDLSL